MILGTPSFYQTRFRKHRSKRINDRLTQMKFLVLLLFLLAEIFSEDSLIFFANYNMNCQIRGQSNIGISRCIFNKDKAQNCTLIYELPAYSPSNMLNWIGRSAIDPQNKKIYFSNTTQDMQNVIWQSQIVEMSFDGTESQKIVDLDISQIPLVKEHVNNLILGRKNAGLYLLLSTQKMRSFTLFVGQLYFHVRLELFVILPKCYSMIHKFFQLPIFSYQELTERYSTMVRFKEAIFILVGLDISNLSMGARILFMGFIILPSLLPSTNLILRIQQFYLFQKSLRCNSQVNWCPLLLVRIFSNLHQISLESASANLLYTFPDYVSTFNYFQGLNSIAYPMNIVVNYTAIGITLWMLNFDAIPFEPLPIHSFYCQQGCNCGVVADIQIYKPTSKFECCIYSR
jgi:hypothetical protein